MFEKCYNRAVVLCEEHGLDISEHHDRLLQCIQVTMSRYANHPQIYSRVNCALHNTVHNLQQRKPSKVVPVGLYPVQGSYTMFNYGFTVDEVFEFVKEHVSPLEFETLQLYVDGCTKTYLAEHYDTVVSVISYRLYRCYRYVQLYLKREYPELFNNRGR